MDKVKLIIYPILKAKYKRKEIKIYEGLLNVKNNSLMSVVDGDMYKEENQNSKLNFIIDKARTKLPDAKSIEFVKIKFEFEKKLYYISVYYTDNNGTKKRHEQNFNNL